MPEEVGKTAASAPDAGSSAVLAESYAQASTELGLRVTDLREERDLARSRLAEVRIALELAEQKAGEGEVEDRAQRILSILMRSVGAANASLLLTTTDPPQILVLPPLVTDPLARTRWGALHLHDLRDLAEARLEEGPFMPALGEALSMSEPVFESVALVPLRSAERGLALALLYYRPHMTLPTAGHARPRGLPGPRPRRAAGGDGGARGDGQRRPHAGGVARLGLGHGVAPDAPAGRVGAPGHAPDRGRPGARCGCRG